jgi:predicted dehydrogenase
VGAGGIAQAYVQVFQSTDRAEMVAVADVRPDAAEALAENFGCRSFASHGEMLAATDIDALLVCTPPATHREIALEAVGAGRHVLCEKPLAIDVESAQEMVEAAAHAGVVLTMAAKFRFVEDVISAKSILSSGILGDVILFENVFASRVDMTNRWNSDPAVSGGGVLIDNGTHSVDIVRYFLGPITEVMAVEGKRVQNLAVEDTAQLFIRTADGARGTVDLSWSVDKSVDSFINIYGSHGTICVGWKSSRYRQTSSADWVSFGEGYQKVSCMRKAVENFCDAVRGEDRLRITAADAIASVGVIEAAYRSMGRSNWVPTRANGNSEPTPADARVA